MDIIQSWENVTPHLRQWNWYGWNFCVSSVLKLTQNLPMTAPQRNPTLPWPDFHFNAGNVNFQNRSFSCHFPKSAFALWQDRINNCIFFSLIVLIMPRPTPWVLVMKCLHLPVKACSKVILLVSWVWLVLPSTASSGGMLPLELWYQASHRGCPEGHTSSRWRIVEDGATESLHKCSGLDNRRLPHVYRTYNPQGSPVDCQPPPSLLGVSTDVAKVPAKVPDL